jgi:hypothetical protein
VDVEDEPHAWQYVEFSKGWYIPAGQSAQALIDRPPVRLLNVPTGHGVGAKLPAGQ